MTLPSNSPSETESLNDQDIWDDRDGDAIFDEQTVRSQLRLMTTSLLLDANITHSEGAVLEKEGK